MKLRQKVEAKLKENGNLQLNFVLDVLNQEIDVDEGRARIDGFYRSIDALSKYLDEREKELAGRTYDDAAHQLLKTEVQTHKQTIETMNQDIGRLETEIITLKSDALKFASLKTELEKAELRRQDISELKNLFRGSGFVNYVSTVYLQNLCKAANERFYKLTRQKLGFELAEDNSFHVRDYMNEGRLRSVKTLSGGQTFQASLSLALSLADSIHKVAGSSENFFFLDEGFGTLDKETLEVAFETLKSLRKENRIVGVISHVEEMQIEIETYLEVTNDEEHGSIVKASWENK
jgi:exonuclease SbcC